VVDADLQSYFDTIPHSALLAKVGNRIADGRVLGLVELFGDNYPVRFSDNYLDRLNDT
jgi:retron-type reverse transcriptase